MRGILEDHGGFDQHVRFIPADAGNTIPGRLALWPAPVHPRGCGEYEPEEPSGMPGYGSSPRMRGIRFFQVRRHGCDRFIPADAGNTGIQGGLLVGFAVHPRGCGEYILAGNALIVRSGSSPRMRGILSWRFRLTIAGRFIPADAGNTRSSEAGGYVFAVHPRGCGEYARCTPLDWLMIGSSPRMRGIRSASQRSASQRRFIPADAGNTTRHTITSPMPSVHPRGCGEYGPSGGGKTFVVRFIPADAGNTSRRWLVAVWLAVHPRGCGEYPCVMRG